MRSGAARRPELTVVPNTAAITPALVTSHPDVKPAPASQGWWPLDKDSRRWLSSLAIVLVAYGAPLAWWIGTPGNTQLAAPPSAAMIVELGLEPAAPTSEQEAPPGPEQQESAPPPEPDPLPKPEPDIPAAPLASDPEVAVNPEPEIEPEPEPLPEPLPEPDNQEAPREEQAAPTTTSPTAAPAQADHTSAPVQGTPSQSNAASQAPAWRDRLLHRLETAKRYPHQARRMRQEGVSYLRFTMDREGMVLAASIEESSGHQLLDNEVLALIRRAQPLPTPPPEVAGETLDLVVPVEFFLRR